MTVVRMKSIDQHGLEDIGKFSALGGGLTSNVEQVCIYGMLLLFCSFLFRLLSDHSCSSQLHCFFP